jgi:excisionase family DNA binding protein
MPFQGTAMPETGAGLSDKPFYRVAEIAARFDVDQSTVYRQIKAGHLSAVRIGSRRGTVRVPAAALAEYEASITTIVTESAELTVDTLFGDVDMVAVDRARSGQRVKLTRAEAIILALLTAHTSTATAPVVMAEVA